MARQPEPSSTSVFEELRRLRQRVWRLEGSSPLTGSGMSVPEAGVVQIDSHLDAVGGLSYSAAWRNSTSYRAGQLALDSSGMLVVALETHTSDTTFEPARWRTVNAPSPATPVFSATQATPQTGVALNTWTAVLFDVELIDTHGGHDNVTNPSRYTIPAGRGGIWQFQGVVAIGVGTGYGGVCLAVNGVRVKGSAVAKASGAPTVATPAKLVAVAAGDYVEVLWYLDSATGTYVQADFASSFDGRFIQ